MKQTESIFETASPFDNSKYCEACKHNFFSRFAACLTSCRDAVTEVLEENNRLREQIIEYEKKIIDYQETIADLYDDLVFEKGGDD